jgi:hypothetical protein
MTEASRVVNIENRAQGRLGRGREWKKMNLKAVGGGGGGRAKGMDEGTIKTPIHKCCLYWCFSLGWCSNFVGSESGQKQSVKLLQNMVYNTTQPPPPSPPATHCLYILCVYFGKGGRGGEVREKVEGQQFTRGVENTNMTDCISNL